QGNPADGRPALGHVRATGAAGEIDAPMRDGLAAAFLTLLAGTVSASADVRQIFWKDLRPATQPAAESLGLPVVAASLPDHGETLAWANPEMTVELKGYALPTDREG